MSKKKQEQVKNSENMWKRVKTGETGESVWKRIKLGENN